MSEKDRKFWLGDSNYQELAEKFERNVEVTHPSGHFECKITGIGGHCPFCATSVKYYRYNGPKI